MWKNSEEVLATWLPIFIMQLLKKYNVKTLEEISQPDYTATDDDRDNIFPKPDTLGADHATTLDLLIGHASILFLLLL